SKIEFEYEGAMATVKTGVGVKTEGQLVVSGTKGYVIAPSPWWLTKHFEVRYEEEEYKDGQGVEVYEPAFRGDGLRYEISEFVMKINGYAKNSYKLTAGESIVMADITEKYMKYKESMKH
ncbi:MAG: glycerol-3-phosphate cytidylyltransferase, partial [Lachnospiraceae bacterium]|nr:glycerol-3-phosphate cytidylyltransferase [Lachnospiraceae bacterium]